MKKFISILKATMSGDMNVFKYNFRKDGKKDNKIKSLVGPMFLAIVIFAIFYQYAMMIGGPLKEVGLTYVMLTLFVIFSVILTLIEGIYKSQGILFDAKDNDLLFSLPIKKSQVLSSRIIKLISFQYIFNFLFTAPAYVVYAVLENPEPIYYILAIIMFILVPIIPTIIACIIGYIIKAFSSVVKNKKAIQTILSLAVTFGIFYLSFGTKDFIGNIAQNATGINDLLSKIYYPAGLFVELVQQFSIAKFLILLAINVIPAIVFIWIFSINYFKIISKSSENSSKSNFKFNKEKTKARSQLKALTVKELKKYFSTPIYVFNTAFGLILILIVAVGMSINFEGTMSMLTKDEDIGMSLNDIISFIPKIFMAILIFMTSMVSITASSISLEGKSFNITKSLPVSTKKIFLAKILMSDIVSIPLILIISIILIIRFGLGAFDASVLIVLSILMPTFFAILGLIINLKYPMLDAKSDTVVVKQSTSTLIVILLGMALSIATIMGCIGLSALINIDVSIGIILTVIIIATIVVWRVLNTYGKKKFAELSA